MKTTTTVRLNSQPVAHVSHAACRVLIIASLFAISLPMVSAQTDISRAASWAASAAAVAPATFNGNSHGSTQNPTDAVWRYYLQAGRDADGLISRLLPSTWTAMPFSASEFRLNEPVGGVNRGYVTASATGLTSFWNKTGSPETNPVDAFRPAWSIASYTELAEEGGIYDIGGALSWSLARTKDSGAILVKIAKISGASVTELFSQTVSSSALGTFEIFNATSVPASLTGISLQQGEQLAFAIRGSTTQFRTITLDDSALTLTLRSVPELRVTALLSGLAVLLIVVIRRAKSQSTH
ncbi:hypothetical protein Ga0100231_019410 [Opitutaceae bacterium TAV4]|uniref:hypothetical protein n=1 Tax=Geminisphaera colitermitum TaxID=1148786 RepID=UPI000F629695|nr:hypothetical protein [Geminisphaera colitermitum]RRJ96112.1 hypothetical protein Ga0100231_019410 [Opitutaceae bacterium TAV4]RRK00246.1 hypothetical protein Ga0100230_020085 [Opitutaceae bacterium TAV3]